MRNLQWRWIIIWVTGPQHPNRRRIRQRPIHSRLLHHLLLTAIHQIQIRRHGHLRLPPHTNLLHLPINIVPRLPRQPLRHALIKRMLDHIPHRNPLPRITLDHSREEVDALLAD